MRIMHLLSLYIWRQFLEYMAWRGFLVTLVLNQAVSPVLGLIVWSVVLPGNSSISTYYVALLVVQLATVSYEQHTLANGIYAGSLSHDLLRPQPVIIGALGGNIAMRLLHLLFGLPLFIIAGVLAGVLFDPLTFLLALPALLLAAMLRFLFTYILALSALWTQHAHGLVGFGETLIFLLGGSAAPIAFFPDAVRPLGEMLPFRSMLGFPAEVASGSLSLQQILVGYGWQGFWLVVLVLATGYVWRSGVRHYTAIGG